MGHPVSQVSQAIRGIHLDNIDAVVLVGDPMSSAAQWMLHPSFPQDFPFTKNEFSSRYITYSR